MTMPGGAELFVILFIVLLLFGAKKLPDLAGSVGTSLKEFKKATKEAAAEEEEEQSNDEADALPAATGETTTATSARDDDR
jgi:sec-independent protein translocase protein TatA